MLFWRWQYKLWLDNLSYVECTPRLEWSHRQEDLWKDAESTARVAYLLWVLKVKTSKAVALAKFPFCTPVATQAVRVLTCTILEVVARTLQGKRTIALLPMPRDILVTVTQGLACSVKKVTHDDDWSCLKRQERQAFLDGEWWAEVMGELLPKL